MILTPAAAFEALSNVSHISLTLNCGEIYRRVQKSLATLDRTSTNYRRL